MKSKMATSRQLAEEAVEEALQQLPREGRVYDTGKRKWSSVTRKYEIVWASSELATKH